MKYTPYRLGKNATAKEVEANQRERAFYDMSGSENIYKYIMTEGKRSGKKTALEYLQKNTGVFNHNGMIGKEEIEAMKKRAQENKGNLWHGFISLSEEDSPKIDTPEKCIHLVKSVFPTFFKEAHLGEKNIDLMCALHLDRPHHLHIHFVFWEKEPKYKNKTEYRAKGKISREAIDNAFVRLGLFVGEDKGTLYQARDKSLQRLREMTAVKTAMSSREDIEEKILSLAKALPKTGRLSYGSKDMEKFRGRVDEIVKLILDYDKEARKADLDFYRTLDEKKKIIANICGNPYAFSAGKSNPEVVEKELPKYHHKIDESHIKIVEEIEADYKRRQGNLVLNLAKFIRPEYYERNKNVKYKANDKRLKRKLSMSKFALTKRFNKFFNSIGREFRLFERDFSHRLQEIEEEMREEKQRQEQEAQYNNRKGDFYKK